MYARKPRLWRRTARGIFYILWTEEGKTKKLSTRTVERAAAEAALRAFLEDLERPDRHVQAMTLHDAVRTWLLDRRRPRHGLSPATLRGYQGWADRFIGHFPAALLAKDVTPADVRGFLDKQEDAGLSASTLRKQAGGLSMVFEFLIREGHPLRNPCRAIQIRAEVKRHPAMTDEEYQSLCSAIEEEQQLSQDPRLREGARHLLDLARVLWNSGLRFVEATRLTWEDISLEERLWTIRSPRNKGGVQVLPMHDVVASVLRRRLGEGETSPFPEYWALEHSWQSFKRRHASFRGWSWHRMRHAFVTRLRRAGRDAAALALARHSSALMSDHYTHLNVEDLRKDLEAV